MHGEHANHIDARCSHVAVAGHFYAAAAGADPASWRRSKLPLRASPLGHSWSGAVGGSPQCDRANEFVRSDGADRAPAVPW